MSRNQQGPLGNAIGIRPKDLHERTFHNSAAANQFYDWHVQRAKDFSLENPGQRVATGRMLAFLEMANPPICLEDTEEKRDKGVSSDDAYAAISRICRAKFVVVEPLVRYTPQFLLCFSCTTCLTSLPTGMQVFNFGRTVDEVKSWAPEFAESVVLKLCTTGDVPVPNYIAAKRNLGKNAAVRSVSHALLANTVLSAAD